MAKFETVLKDRTFDEWVERLEDGIIKSRHELPPVNPINGGTSTLARKDRSWSSVPDFFWKLFKK